MASGNTAKWYRNTSVIDGTEEATHTIETTPTESGYTRDFYLHGVQVLINDANNIFGACRINVGTTGPNYNNIVSNQPIGTTTGLLLPLTLASGTGVIGMGVDIKCKITQEATALLGEPTCDFTVILHGHDEIY